MTSDDPTLRARSSATDAARRSGIQVRPLLSSERSRACEQLLCEVWQADPERPPIAADVIQAMAESGSYVVGATDKTGETDRLLAACIGLWSQPGRREMHSHIAGVHASARRRAIGFALKLDQRAHALENNVNEITWTFDPLVARNAHFNLRKLGGLVDGYFVNHYGRLYDALNGEDDSDRLLLRWNLLSEAAATAGDNRDPVVKSTPNTVLGIESDRPVAHRIADQIMLVTIPRDIEQIRSRAPELAREWRVAVRDTLGTLLADGATIIDFDRVACGYVVRRGDR